MIDFLVTYYNPETLERDSNGVLGLDDQRFFGKNFIPVSLDDGLVNPKFIDFASKVGFFRCECDRGSASFRGENRTSKKGEKQYWYAYKRVNGKLNRFNIGDISKINYETIEKAIAVVCGFKQEEPVTQPVTQPVTLAGHGKLANQIQFDLLDHMDSLAIAQNEIAVLTKMLKEAQDDVATANRKEHEQYVLNGQLKGKLSKIEKTLQERDDELLKTHQKLLERNYTIELQATQIKDAMAKLETHRNVGLAIAIQKERMVELEHTIEMQADLIKSLRNDVFNLECESSKREDDVAGYAYMYDEHSNKIFEYQALIEKYRAMTIDKTKKGNPRYAYLIDFLSDIDKIS